METSICDGLKASSLNNRSHWAVISKNNPMKKFFLKFIQMSKFIQMRILSEKRFLLYGMEMPLFKYLNIFEYLVDKSLLKVNTIAIRKTSQFAVSLYFHYGQGNLPIKTPRYKCNFPFVVYEMTFK